MLQAITWIMCSLIPVASQAATTLRPPSVPLVACDPYFSIWSPADKLTDADTVHWTGTPQRLSSQARIDGLDFRLMGKEPAAAPALPQTGLEVLPTRTIYTFKGAGVRLTLTFMTAALPDDLMIYSRPVTYVTWELKATDGKDHDIGLTFETTGEPAVNVASQEVVSMTEEHGDLVAAIVGSREQPVLAKKGDNLRIDWGYLYVAFPKSEFEGLTLSGLRSGQREVFQDGFQSRIELMNPVQADSFFITAKASVGKVGAKPVSRWLMLAYDDQYSIQYFKKNLRPYWRRNGDDAAALLKKAAAEYESLKKRCAKFDAEPTASATRQTKSLSMPTASRSCSPRRTSPTAALAPWM
jgi:hypothetical protein